MKLNEMLSYVKIKTFLLTTLIHSAKILNFEYLFLYLNRCVPYVICLCILCNIICIGITAVDTTLYLLAANHYRLTDII